jgi:hypothetical protein
MELPVYSLVMSRKRVRLEVHSDRKGIRICQYINRKVDNYPGRAAAIAGSLLLDVVLNLS